MAKQEPAPAKSPFVRREWLTRASGREAIRPLLGDSRYSQSMLRAAMLFASLPVNGTSRRLSALAETIGVPAGTARRYMETLCTIGLAAPTEGAAAYRRTCAVLRRGEMDRGDGGANEAERAASPAVLSEMAARRVLTAEAAQEIRGVTARNVRRAREHAGLSRRTLEARSGISRTTIERVEKAREAATVLTLVALALGLDADPADFLRGLSGAEPE